MDKIEEIDHLGLGLAQKLKKLVPLEEHGSQGKGLKGSEIKKAPQIRSFLMLCPTLEFFRTNLSKI